MKLLNVCAGFVIFGLAGIQPAHALDYSDTVNKAVDKTEAGATGKTDQAADTVNRGITNAAGPNTLTQSVTGQVNKQAGGAKEKTHQTSEKAKQTLGTVEGVGADLPK